MATQTPVSILLLSLILAVLCASPAFGNRTIWHKQRKCMQLKREVEHLTEELHTVKEECPKRQMWYYKKAKNTHGCEFSPRNGLRAVYKMKKVCWRAKWNGHKYYRACTKKSRACKNALYFVTQGDAMRCDRKIRKLSWLLRVAVKKFEYVKYFCQPKPSNAPRAPGKRGRKNRW